MSNVVFIVATHGNTSTALVKTVEMLIGEQELVHDVDFVPGENADTLVTKYKNIIEKYSDKKFIIFVDMWGGSPFNAANLVSQEHDVNVISGVNIPILLASLDARDEGASFEEIVHTALKEGRSGIKSLQNNVEESDSEEDDNTENKIGSQEIEQAKGKDHFNISLVRIDDRLIHGQVATMWTKISNVKRIIVISDDVAKDKVRTSMLKTAVPPGVSAHVVDIAKATRVYNNPEYKDERVMLLFTNPSDIVKVVEAGFDIKTVNIGGTAWKEGRTMIDSSVSLDKKDIEAYKALDAKGIELEIRKVVNDTKRNMIDEIKKLESTK